MGQWTVPIYGGKWMQFIKVTQFWELYPLKKVDFLHDGIAGEPKCLGSKVLVVSA